MNEDRTEPFAGLLPAGVAVAWTDGSTQPDALHEVEAAVVARAIDKRRHEFALGRMCARRALAQLGLQATAIPARADRSPVWPERVVGSITHCQGFAAAAVARADRLFGVGLDAEPATPPLERKLVRLICTDAEAAALDSRAPLDGVDWPRLVFSAKEAVYKAVAPGAGLFLGFHDVELDVEPASGTFTARLVRDPDPRLPDFARLRGHYRLWGGYLLTTAVVPA